METSILKSVKKKLNVDPLNTAFDQDILEHINGAFSTLTQMGVGPLVFQITDDTADWSDYSTDDVLLGFVKTYVGLKTRMLFDPPATSFLQKAITDEIAEFESRISSYREDLEWTDPTAVV
jgi:hypothetical protein